MGAFARTYGVGLLGVHGHLVEVEAHLAPGLPALVISGLADTAVAEARDRVRAAVLNSGGTWPAHRITVGLGPAWLPKRGSALDLPVAVAILAAAGVIPPVALEAVVVVGELGLDGRVRPVRGVFPAVLAGLRGGLTCAVVPAANAPEAALVPGIRVCGVHTLRGAVALLRGDDPPECERAGPTTVRLGPSTEASAAESDPGDLADVVGQETGRRAVELAAAGGHHLAFFGAPGSGKTMLAERLPGVLPPLDDEAAMEVTAVQSVAGMLAAGAPLVRRPPYQAPHHTATVAALVGGGSGLARPGVLSRAHRGVVFLDEAPEFSARALDALRQPLERGEVVLARAEGVTRYPARIQLVLAANPCPCASPAGDAACTCSATTRRRYLGRLSGPLLDRIDATVELLPVGAALHADRDPPEPTAVVAARVATARAAARGRWSAAGWRTNAEVPGSALRSRPWSLPRRVTAPLDHQLTSGGLSARGFDRTLRMAWTLGDLAGRTVPDEGDVGEALFFRLGAAA